MAISLIDEIAQSSEWREGEFAKFKVNANGVDEVLWCRMCVPMIYAHWEGFVSSSLRELLRFLNNQALRPSECKVNIIVVGLGDAYQTLSGKQSFSQRVNFTNSFQEMFAKTLNFGSKINTKSNLNSKVLKEICEMFGFNFENFKELTSDIDRLVSIRNAIAHGENSHILDQEKISHYIVIVTKAMDVLLNEIGAFVESQSFLKEQVA